MATIKSYTTVEQSRKLAEILSIESADMYWLNKYTDLIETKYKPFIIDKSNKYIDFFKSYAVAVDNNEIIPCWSLAVLLEEIPDTIVNMVGEGLKLHIDKDGFQYSLFYENEYTGNMFEIETELYDDMIDACYEMIIKLHEQKLL